MIYDEETTIRTLSFRNCDVKFIPIVPTENVFLTQSSKPSIFFLF